MSQYTVLIQAIRNVIKQNGDNKITGEILQQSLIAMINSLGVGYQYCGIATPDTDPGVPDYRGFWLAFEPGNYAHFAAHINLVDGEVGIIYRDQTITMIKLPLVQGSQYLTAASVLSVVQSGYVWPGRYYDRTSQQIELSTNYDLVIFAVLPGATHYDISGVTMASGAMQFSGYPDGANFVGEVSGNWYYSTVLSGAKYICFNLSRTANPDLSQMVIKQPGGLVESVDGLLSYKGKLDQCIEIVNMPVGKNYIDEIDLLRGYYISSGVIVPNEYGIMSNKLYLEHNRKYTLQGIYPYNTGQTYMGYYDANHNYLGRIGFNIGTVGTIGSGTFTYDAYAFANAAYCRIVLQWSHNYLIDIDDVQLELGDQATTVEPFVGTASGIFKGRFEGTSEGGVSMILTGASFADHNVGNTWFERVCDKLGAIGYNKAVSGENILDTAQKMHDGTLYTAAEFEEAEVFVIMHTHNFDVADASEILPDYHDYTFPMTNPAAAWDYVLKKWIADSYALKDDATSKYYGNDFGKPINIVVLTHWHDGRTTYNDSIRLLRDKFGFALVELDKLIGFSRHQVHPTTGEQVSRIYAVDTETIDDVVYGWHPLRTGMAWPQERIASLVASKLKEIDR